MTGRAAGTSAGPQSGSDAPGMSIAAVWEAPSVVQFLAAAKSGTLTTFTPSLSAHASREPDGENVGEQELAARRRAVAVDETGNADPGGYGSLSRNSRGKTGT